MVILVTGISSGFGLATAKALADSGHCVYGTVRREVENPIPGVRYLNADVRDTCQVASAVETVIREQGCIDALVNNAGMGIGGPIEFATDEQVRLQMDSNFMGLVNFCREIIPHMRKRGKGRIVAISSIGGLMGLPFQGFYSASKFAIEGYCEALRLELKSCGVQVVVVEPGDFHTSFTAKRQKASCKEAFEAYPSYAAGMDSIEKDENGGLSPSVLAARIVKIVECKRPACNYVVATFEQRLSVFLKKILPVRLFGDILGSYYKL